MNGDEIDTITYLGTVKGQSILEIQKMCLPIDPTY